MPLVSAKDARAFEVFYDRHAAAAYSLARRIVGDQRIAEDVTQEALLVIWRKGASYDPARGSVRSWALGIVRNRAIDQLRSATSSRVPKLELDGEAALEREASPARTDTQAIDRETSVELQSVLRKLPQEQAQVLELAYFAGFSQPQICELLNLPLGTVKSRIRLGLERIRTDLAEGLA